jgi:hypothetical protein
MMNAIERIAKAKDENRQLRLALVSSGKFDEFELFPELKPTVDDDTAELPEESDADGEPIATKYDFSNASFDPKQVEEDVREMLARAAQGSANFEAPTYTDWV